MSTLDEDEEYEPNIRKEKNEPIEVIEETLISDKSPKTPSVEPQNSSSSSDESAAEQVGVNNQQNENE
eukprot:CAMPEP_0201582676 /NCGR_PEP_ID=MMETSP0190_2-20130828/88708_1 /ASSEMBLY_ACC=CAM_ASM_000263 /TAXON_ID=37353 /ORGANISM="Rosalina sp." /LENGTH=67 /DNA_ID=CAMNT_0048023055 /DNA_START=15 /DNA_END=215 /DNA_ORIENTATION=+